MKKYVAPMSGVLSVNMDENIAISKINLNGDYSVIGDKIQNSVFTYTDYESGYLSGILGDIANWLGRDDLGFDLATELTKVTTDCYIGHNQK